MKFVVVNEEQLIREKKIYKEQQKEMKEKLESFCDSYVECVEVIDDDKFYNNNNDFYRSIANRIAIANMPIKAFMLNGRVYLKRKQFLVELEAKEL